MQKIFQFCWEFFLCQKIVLAPENKNLRNKTCFTFLVLVPGSAFSITYWLCGFGQVSQPSSSLNFFIWKSELIIYLPQRVIRKAAGNNRGKTSIAQHLLILFLTPSIPLFYLLLLLWSNYLSKEAKTFVYQYTQGHHVAQSLLVPLALWSSFALGAPFT